MPSAREMADTLSSGPELPPYQGQDSPWIEDNYLNLAVDTPGLGI